MHIVLNVNEDQWMFVYLFRHSVDKQKYGGAYFLPKKDYPTAVEAYSHADWYEKEVLKAINEKLNVTPHEGQALDPEQPQ